MTKIFSLQPLLHLAQKKNDAATKKLGLLNLKQQSAQSKLEMLQQYRRDYQDKLRSVEIDGLPLEDLRNFQDFIYRLDDAIKQQSTAVEQAHSSFQTGRNELSETQRRMKSFDTLAQRHSDVERKLEGKNEQRLQDEHSRRRLAYKYAEHGEEN